MINLYNVNVFYDNTKVIIIVNYFGHNALLHKSTIRRTK